MFLSERIEQAKGVRGRRTITIGIFQCDGCQRKFERRLPEWKRKFVKHFCSCHCVHLGRKHTDEHNRKISESILGEKNPFYGKHHTDETCQKMSDARTGIELSTSTRVKLSQRFSGVGNPFYGKHHTDETRQMMSEIRASNIASGKVYACAHGRHGIFTSHKTGQQRYDSAYEYARMLILDQDDDVLMWTKKHGIKLSYVFNGCQKFYVPDFLVTRKTHQVIEECKGYEREDVLTLKLEALKLYCEEINVQYAVYHTTDMQQMVMTHLGKTLAQIRSELP